MSARLRQPIIVFAIALLTAGATAGCDLQATEDGLADAVNDTVEAVTPVETATVPSGTVIHVRLDDRLDSGESTAGQEFSMTVSRAVTDQDRVLIPEGSMIFGVVESVEPAGRPEKSGRMELRVSDLDVRGETVGIDGTLRFEGEGSSREDLKEIGIGGAIGAAVGAILEGGKGAVIGGIAGAGGTFLATKGEQVELEPGTPLVVELKDDVAVPVSS